jgi:hypothetical protein
MEKYWITNLWKISLCICEDFENLWYDPNNVRFEFWRKTSYCPVLFYWAWLLTQLLDGDEIFTGVFRHVILYWLEFQVNQSLQRDYFRGSKLLDESCQIYLFGPSSTFLTLSRAT